MRQGIRGLLVLAVVFAVAGSAAAATVTLTNGDRITGEVRGVRDGGLVLASPHMGEVVLDLAGISTLESEKPLAVYFASGERAVGTISSPGAGQVRIHGETGIQAATLSEITGIAAAPAERGEALRAAIEVLGEGGDAAPSPWKAKIEFGANYSAGNTDRRGFHVVFDAKRETPDDIFAVRAANYYAEENEVRQVNEQHLSFREDLKFDPWYVFALLALERDEFEDIDLRATFSPGVGRILADSEDFKAKGEIGPSVMYEDFRSGDHQWTLQLRIGFHAELRVFERAKLTEDLQIFPQFDDGLEWRIESETGFENALSENLFFKLGLRYDYNSRVSPGIEHWDVKLLASLVYEF